MFIIYVIDFSNKNKCKDGGSYFYKNQKYRPLEIEKKNFFSYFFSEIPNFPYKRFFRKCSMFGWSIPLIKNQNAFFFHNLFLAHILDIFPNFYNRKH